MATACKSDAQTYTIETSLGNIKIRLYENTPLHKANFEKLVAGNAYDSVLFHRIINGFMIQTGDLGTKPGAGENTPEGEKIPAEFCPEYFHKKGALAAARIGDQFNPEKKSSPTQFYIVQGRPFSEAELAQIGASYGKTWTDEQKAVYQTLGGTPFLDMDYTVFGEVVEGLDIVDKIAATPTGQGDRPLGDVRILRIK
ncbi:MAG: peptidylprolyl isomerase [Dysgonamonadaceae bacterium]|nr:peptidylprolyl isomerase [Dysgonamonadaceae bacterium]